MRTHAAVQPLVLRTSHRCCVPSDRCQGYTGTSATLQQLEAADPNMRGLTPLRRVSYAFAILPLGVFDGCHTQYASFPTLAHRDRDELTTGSRLLLPLAVTVYVLHGKSGHQQLLPLCLEFLLGSVVKGNFAWLLRASQMLRWLLLYFLSAAEA